MITDYILFFKRCWPLLIFGMSTVFWGNFGQSFYVSWYGASFQNSLGISATGYGAAYSLATLGSGLLLLWFGGVIDKISLRWFVTICSLGLFTAALMLWQVDSLIGLVISLFLLRLFGQGLLPHTAITTMTREFAVHRGKAVSVATSGLPLGEVILPACTVFLIATFGWQKSWLFIGLSVVFLYLPFAQWLLGRSRLLKYAEDRGMPDRNGKRPFLKQGSRRTLLSDHRFWFALPAILASPFIITGIFIHQGFFLSEMGWTPLLFAGCFVFYGCTHWLSSMCAGSLVDTFSAVHLLKFYPLPMLVGLLIPVIGTGNWVAYMLMILLGASIGSSSPIISSLWAEVYGTKNLGAIRSLVSSLAVLSTAVSPILFGLLIDTGISGQVLLAWLVFYVAVAIVLSMFSFSAKRLS